MTRNTAVSQGFDPRRLGLESSTLKSRILQGKAFRQTSQEPPPARRESPAPPKAVSKSPKASPRAPKARRKAEKAQRPQWSGRKRLLAGTAIAGIGALTLAFVMIEPAEEHAAGVRVVSIDETATLAAAPPSVSESRNPEGSDSLVAAAQRPRTGASLEAFRPQEAQPIRNLRERLEQTIAENRRLSEALALSGDERRKLVEERAEARAKAAALSARLQDLQRQRDALLSAREDERLEARRHIFAAADTTMPLPDAASAAKTDQANAPGEVESSAVQPDPASQPAQVRTEARDEPDNRAAGPSQPTSTNPLNSTSPNDASPALMPRSSAALKTQPSADQRAALRVGVEAYKAGRYAEAQDRWLPLAQAGYPWAQFLLGSLLSEGRTPEASTQAAFAWLKLAHDNGVPEAAQMLERLDRPLSVEKTQPSDAGSG